MAWLLYHTARGLDNPLPKLLSHLIRYIALHHTRLRHSRLHHARLYPRLHHSWIHHTWCRWRHSSGFWLSWMRRLRVHSSEIWLLRLDHRLSCYLDQPVSLDNRPALLFRKLSNRLQVFIKSNFVVFKCFFDDSHTVLKRRDFAVELYKFLREWVWRVHKIVDVAWIDGRGTLTFTNDFLHLFIFLL